MPINNNQDYNIKQQEVQFSGRIDRKKKSKPQPLDTDVQRFAVEVLSNLYDNCAQIVDEYGKNRGIADAGTYIEGAREILDWASFGHIKSTSHINDNLKRKSLEIKALNINDNKNFKDKFKELSGIEYDENRIREFMQYVSSDKVDTESEEFKDLCEKAFGLRGTEKQQKYVSRSATVDGLGDIVLMLVTLGAVSKTKLMGKLTSKLYKSLEKSTGKYLPKAKEKVAKLGTSMIMGGGTLAGFTLTKETLDNITNPTRDSGSFATWKQTGIASLESFGFGAMGGLLNETVVGPLVKYLSKPAKQTAQAVSKVLSENSEVSGKEILQASLKSQNPTLSGLFKMSTSELQNFGRVIGAHAAGFGVEVAGFAGYEAALDAVKDICDPKTGRLPEDMTFENLTKYLTHKLGEQFSNLGTIKGISQLLMMRKGGRAVQNAMITKMIEESEKLSDVKFKKVNDNGNEAIEMSLPDGSKQRFATAQQAIQTCEAVMQMELIVNNIKEQQKKTQETQKTHQAEKAPEIKEESTAIQPPRKITIEKATESDLKEIQQIDLEAFDGRYEIESDFEDYKTDLIEQGVETFAMKTDDGNIAGYYQLEPVNKNELYIYSLGIKKEFRNSKTAYKALKQMQEQITELAKEQNLDRVILDVDSSKPELVKLYKKFGFEITGEHSRYEAGHDFTDYRMVADVKKILGVKEGNISEPAKITKSETAKPAEETKEVKPEEAIEEKETVKTAKSEEEPFFVVPEADKTLTEVSINGYENFHGKLRQKDGKNFITLNGHDYEIHYTDMDNIVNTIFAHEIYDKAGFKSEKYVIDIGGQSGYLTPVTDKIPRYAIEKLEQRFGINIYLDKMNIQENGAIFYKDGKAVKLQLVEENDSRLDINDSPDTVYATKEELLETLKKLTNTKLSELSTKYYFKDNNIPNEEAATEIIKTRRNEVKRLYNELRPQYEKSSHPIIDEKISRGIQEIEFDDWHQRSLDGFLETKFDEGSHEDKQQKLFKFLIERNPAIKPYIAELKSLIYCWNNKALNSVYSSIDKTSHYQEITVERAASYISILKGKNNRNLEPKDFEKLQTIPDKFISLCVFVDGIKSIDSIKYNWDNKCSQKAGDLKLQDYTETPIEEKILLDIAHGLYDEYGEICDYKTDLAKTLLQFSPDMAKHYNSYCSSGPYCVVSEILRFCENKEQCSEIINKILPALKEQGLTYKEGVTQKEIKFLLDSIPEEKAERLEALKLLRNQSDSFYDYDQKLDYIINNHEKLTLYKELSSQGFKEYSIRQIFDSAKTYPLKTLNPEMVEFLKSLEKFNEIEDVDANTLRQKFADKYKDAINNNDYEAKVDIINKISQVSELVNNPARAKYPLTLEQICEILNLPTEQYQKVRDALYLKDGGGFELRVDSNNGNDFYQIINTLSNDVYLKRFYEDYLPLAKNKNYARYGLQHGCYMVQLLKAEKLVGRTDIKKSDYQTTLHNLKYLLENNLKYNDSELVDLSLLSRKQFENFINYVNNITSLKPEQQPASYYKVWAAQLSEQKFEVFKNNIIPRLPRLIPELPINDPHSYKLNDIFRYVIDDYLKLSGKQLDMIINAIEYFTPNYTKLRGVNDAVKPSDVIELIHKKHKGVIAISELAGQKALFHAIEYKYKGLENLLGNCFFLNYLEPKLKTLLKNKLETLPHPEQKLEKLSIIAALSDKVSPEALENIVKSIKSPEMTTTQQELADSIFAGRTESYDTQIERFIREFNVPKARQNTIRKFLQSQNLQDKYLTPPPIGKQIEVLDKKINSIISNAKIPHAKSQAYLEVLNKQKQDLLSNPEKYTRRRLNESAMKALSGQVEAHINLPNITKEFNKSINREIYTLLGVEINDNLLNADIQYDSKYFAVLFRSADQINFKTQFTKLLELIKANPDKKLTEIYETMPENRETRRLFNENGLNYDRWIKFDENSHHPFELTVEVEKALDAAKQNLKTELNSELAQKLDQNEVAKLSKILEDMQIDSASQKDLAKIMKAVETAIENNEYWKQNSPEIKEFLDHIKIHKKNIHAVRDLKDSNEELYVRLWDNDDIGRNIFYGNHVGCCTSIGSGNSFAAPQHLMNSFVNGIEIVDKAGNSMGNSMCYFAKVDGELTFVIDSFEANGKLGAAPEVTDAIIDYAKQVCAEMGRPDANIMFGPNYNKVNFSRCVKTEDHTIEVLGRAPERTYIDAVGGYADINRPVNNRAMNEIIDL